MIIKDEPNPSEKISKERNIVNSKRAIHFAMGFVDWFVFQSIYCSIAVLFATRFRSIPLWLASLPINVIAILLILNKWRWIGFGVGIAFSLNLIAIVSMEILGVLYEEGIGTIYILFPPFFLLLTNWLTWLR